MNRHPGFRRPRRPFFLRLESLESRALLSTVRGPALARDYAWQPGPDWPVPADYDGDGAADPALYRPASREWFQQRTASGPQGWAFGPDRWAMPAAADYDGDGAADLAIFHTDRTEWEIRWSDGTTRLENFGNIAHRDWPVPADYDGDGYADLAVYRPAEGRWYVRPSSRPDEVVTYEFGRPDALDWPVPADYDGDGTSDLAVFQPAENRWLAHLSAGGEAEWSLPGYQAGDVPAPADYDGDGRADLALYRPSDGTWLVPESDTTSVRRIDTTSIGVRREDSFWVGRYQAQLAQAQFEAAQVLFLGDSLTEYWDRPEFDALARSALGHAPGVTEWRNYGLASENARGLLYRVENGLLYHPPAVVVVMIGINDLLFLDQSPEDTAASIGAIVHAIRARGAGTRVLVQSVLPDSSPPGAPIHARVHRLNTLLAASADAWGASFLNVAASLLEPDGRLDATRRIDDLHLSPGAYAILADTLRRPLRSLLGRPARDPLSDYDGDGRDDAALFQPSTGRWLVAGSTTGQAIEPGSLVAAPGNEPVPADYDGDGRADIGLFDPERGTWTVRAANRLLLDRVPWGLPGDRPVPGDYDGDGRTDLAVFRPSEARWYLRLAGDPASQAGLAFGQAGDRPVPADYDGDGRTDLAVFRPSESRWYVLESATGAFTTRAWGKSGDEPVPSDYDGDGRTDLAVFRPTENRWYIRSLAGSFLREGVLWGMPGDLPAPADFDGDGRADIAVFRPLEGSWLISTTSGGFRSLLLGDRRFGDVPVVNSAVRTAPATLLLLAASPAAAPAPSAAPEPAAERQRETTRPRPTAKPRAVLRPVAKPRPAPKPKPVAKPRPAPRPRPVAKPRVRPDSQPAGRTAEAAAPPV